MTRDQIIARLMALESELKTEGVSALYLFGSIARGDSQPDSDIDLACNLDEGRPIGLLDFINMQLRLEADLQHSVDLVELGAMHGRVFDHAKADMVRIF
jgi:uncharacterized protein